MKKLLSYLLVIALVLVQFVPVVSAATITITNAEIGQTYNAYKIFDVTKSSTGENYAYSIKNDSEWYTAVVAYQTNHTNQMTLTKSTDGETVVVEVTEAFSAGDFAAHLNQYKSGKTTSDSVVASEATTVLDNLSAGYYFVDSSLGVLCILHTTTENVEVQEKNTPPTVDKTVSKPSASVGETVTFTVSLKAGGNADTSYILHDVMSEGLTLDKTSFTVKIGETAVDADNYTIKFENLKDENCTFEIEFDQEYTANLAAGTTIVITYNAVLNEKAIITSLDKNTVNVQYGNSYSPEKTVEVRNFDFDLVKTTEDGTALQGAKFKLYDKDNNVVELIKVTENNETFYRPVKAEEIPVEVIEAGTAEIKGLASGKYYLEEVEAPEGYNKLTARVEIDLTEGDLTTDVNKEITVKNTTGAMLPSTGGMGTVLFITVGSIMVLGFGVLLVTKLRLSKMEI